MLLDWFIRSLPSSMINLVRLIFRRPQPGVSRMYFPRSQFFRFVRGLWIFLILLLGDAGCENTVSTQFPDDTTGRMPITLSSGDVIKVSFPGTTELSQSQTIQADGKVNLPFIGEVE